MPSEPTLTLEQFYFSGPLVALSLCLLIWTILLTLFICITHPIRRLLDHNASLGTTLSSRATKALNIQLSCIHASGLEPAHLGLLTLFFVHLTSPILALGVMLWAWIMAIYWVCSAIVGNPDGLDGRSDGRELVLATRRWWEMWLLLPA